MAAWIYLLAVLSAIGWASPALVPKEILGNDVTLSLEPLLTGGFKMILTSGGDSHVLGQIGRTLVQPYTMEDIDGGVAVFFTNANLTVRTVYDEAEKARGVKISWDANSLTRLEDCIDFGDKQWYGGPMQLNQVYPIQNAPRTYSGYITAEQDNGAIVERYWLNSAGQYIYVHPDVPLFVDYNNLLSTHLCYGAQIAEPYSVKRQHTPLAYDMWFLADVKTAHKHAVKTYLGHPSGLPDYRMVQHPIWSTWAQYSREIDASKLTDYAKEIAGYGFNNSQFEVDDLWEVCYGSLTVDTNKFPNFKNFVDELKSLGYRVTLWIHPFINKNCEPWYSDALSHGYLALSETSDPTVSWWNNNGTTAAYIDFTNPDAAEWWYNNVKALQDNYGIDSFKFDAGESSFAPQISIQNGDIDLQPHHITQAYVKTCARFGNMIEVRTGFGTQDLPIFVRMVDRDSVWGDNNGLSTIITTTIQMNLNGYTLVLPDMIGGNGYNLDNAWSDLPTKELFIRWVQANAFLPVMQYSIPPWNFDNETTEISRKYSDLHAEYAETIYAAMEASVRDGALVNGPLWWIAPDDLEAQLISDQYLVGEDIVVAPVLKQGATSRDVYLPAGVWYEEGDQNRVQTGPTWLYNYPAPIDVLPYFVRQKSSPGAASVAAVSTTMLLLGLLFNSVF